MDQLMHGHRMALAMRSMTCEGPWESPQGRTPDEDTLFLIRTVETEVIPRLMLLNQRDPSRRASASNDAVVIGVEDIMVFTDAVLDDVAAAWTYVQRTLDRGVSIEVIFLNLLGPAARYLGDLWNADLCEFTDVTIALGRLQGILHRLSRLHVDPIPLQPERHRVLLMQVPGEQHRFGMAMVCDCFRSAGWGVEAHEEPSQADVIRLVREQHFDLVGFSVAIDASVISLAEAIRAVRVHSRHRGIKVMVGGPVLLGRPQVAVLVGADGTAPDARQAILMAEQLVKAPSEGM
ncbi:MAG: B12-binding domain-containing protein [Leptothrix sp. (in: b-proteobacteria)]